MLRTLAVLLLLLGLATATPVVCLCAPDGVVGMITEPAGMTADGHTPESTAIASDSSGLLAASAASAIASVVPTAAGVPSTAPWRLAQPVATSRVAVPTLSVLLGKVWPPDAPPPQSA